MKQKGFLKTGSFFWWGMVLLLTLLAAGCSRAESQTVPDGLQPLASADLSAQTFDADILGEFTLEETAVTTIFYTLPNAEIAYFDLSLTGPDAASHLILHSENYRTDANGGGSWEQTLTPGTYRLVLTAKPGPGALAVYWGHS